MWVREECVREECEGGRSVGKGGRSVGEGGVWVCEGESVCVYICVSLHQPTILGPSVAGLPLGTPPFSPPLLWSSCERAWGGC